MPVVIFAGGQGTRIRDVADDIPKPLIRVGNRPIIWHVMKIYAHYGLKDFIVCLGYKGWLLKEFFLNYQRFTSDFVIDLSKPDHMEYLSDNDPLDWRVTMAETGIPTMTGGRLWRVRKYLEQADIFCVTYGDGLADIDIDALVAFHRSHGKTATVTGVRPAGRFGVLDVVQQNGVTLVNEFTEKPQSLEGFINGGFFVFDHRLWDYMTDDPGLIFERDPLMALSAAGELAVFEHTGFWQPMDTFREWKLLNGMWEAGNAPWMMGDDV
ncbi:MAG: glucose-1-phosphate cytidylyltransferase [Chloroflexota bacterium]